MQPPPRLGPWRVDVDRLLAANTALGGGEHVTMPRIFEDFRALGFDGKHDKLAQAVGPVRHCPAVLTSRPRSAHAAATVTVVWRNPRTENGAATVASTISLHRDQRD